MRLFNSADLLWCAIRTDELHAEGKVMGSSPREMLYAWRYCKFVYLHHNLLHTLSDHFLIPITYIYFHQVIPIYIVLISYFNTPHLSHLSLKSRQLVASFFSGPQTPDRCPPFTCSNNAHSRIPPPTTTQAPFQAMS
jgi:hypothetical protein